MNVDDVVWCDRCPKVVDLIVMTSTGAQFLCKECASMLEFKINSSNFNGGAHRKDRTWKT